MPPGQSSDSNSIIVGNCISCEGLVRVSARTKANASVRCPHCQETFPLLRLLESAAPEVEVVEPVAGANTSAQTSPAKETQPANLYIDEGAETGKDASGKFVVPSQLAKGARRRKSSRRRRSESRSAVRSERESSSESRRDHTSSESPERSSGAGEHSQSRDSEGVAQQSHRSTRHRDSRIEQERKAENTAASDFVKVLFGAMLALPIAYLIVMWVFSRDPLGLGDRLSKIVPFIVPAAFHEDADADSDPTPEASSDEFEDFDSAFSDLIIGEEALQGQGLQN